MVKARGVCKVVPKSPCKFVAMSAHQHFLNYSTIRLPKQNLTCEALLIIKSFINFIKSPTKATRAILYSYRIV